MTMLPVILTSQTIATALGTGADDVVSFSLANTTLAPEHLDFLGLVQARSRQEPTPDAVVLSDGQPLLYLWDLRHQPTHDAQAWRRDMERPALRSDAPYVALLRPGVAQIYALGQARDEGSAPVLEDAELPPGLLAKLALGDVPDRQDGVSTHDLMLELLNVVTEELIQLRGVSSAEALALVGRALFLRFLHDRGILADVDPMPGVRRFTDCLSTPAQAAASSRWLDETFNGDLLTLPRGGSVACFRQLQIIDGTSALDDLSAIIRGDKPMGDGAYQTHFSWNDLHFAYIPVGLLSQVYEAISIALRPTTRKSRASITHPDIWRNTWWTMR